MSSLSTDPRMQFEQYFTQGVHPYNLVEWGTREASVGEYTDQVEFPIDWSQNSVNITASKYFYRDGDHAEFSLKQLIDRVVDTITEQGEQAGYFDSETAVTFSRELKYILLSQRAAFNSPVQFNVGIPGRDPQCSACFILSVEDTMESILHWYYKEGMIFKRGSGSGVNLSAIRSSKETLNGGNQASGPVSFMRGADASAGVIKSGSTARKAAKMVILNVDHPDIEEFIWTKAHEEGKIRALEAAGFDVGFDGKDMTSIQYQNANNSVRVTDEFMRAYEDGGYHELRAITTGEVVDKRDAKQLMRQIAQAAWECADPGMQYDDTINHWHTTPNAGRINGSNPCSEYMHLDNSACNLASINLAKYFGPEGMDVKGFMHTIEVLTTAQDILVGFSSYPTEEIGKNARAYRQLGLGYANLGGMLMSYGIPYDSDDGRTIAGAITSLLTGHCYNTSAKLATVVGPFEGFEQDKEGMLDVLRKHQQAHEDRVLSGNIHSRAPDLVDIVGYAALDSWEEAIASTEQYGIRNAQASVLAPTGTTGLMMDCDTTGIEPDLALNKTKKLVGGGTMKIVNRMVPKALEALGYAPDAIERILGHIKENHSVVNAPGLATEHYSVFATAMGDLAISPMGHIKMMAAVQPFISGAISKTVNLSENVSVDDVEQIFYEGWRLGLKALAIYRDNCKVSQPVSSDKKEATPALSDEQAGVRRKNLPKHRSGSTRSFRIGEAKGYLTTNHYEDGMPGEVFIKLGKQGTTLSGVMDAFAISMSLGLQYGVPMSVYVDKLKGMQFEPQGMTNDEDIRFASSLVDYVARRIAIDYMDRDERNEMGVYSIQDKMDSLDIDESEGPQESVSDPDAPVCMTCGTKMRRAGSCHVCEDCGTSSGCS